MRKNKRDSFFGYSGDSEFLQWTWNELFEHIFQQTMVAIARGVTGIDNENGKDFRSVLNMSVKMAAAWALYHDVGS